MQPMSIDPFNNGMDAISSDEEDDLDQLDEPISWRLIHDPAIATVDPDYEKHPAVNASNREHKIFSCDGLYLSTKQPIRYNLIKSLSKEKPEDPRLRKSTDHFGQIKFEPVFPPAILPKSFKTTKFDVDANFIGKLPNKTLVISRLHNEVTRQDLEDSFKQIWGDQHIEKISLYGPPHQAPVPTGLAKVVFRSPIKCQQAQKYLDRRNFLKAPMIYACFDPKGEWLQFLFENISKGKMRPDNVPCKETYQKLKFNKLKEKESRKQLEELQRRKEKEREEEHLEKLRIQQEREMAQARMIEPRTPEEHVQTPSPTSSPDTNHDFANRLKKLNTSDEIEDRRHKSLTPPSKHRQKESKSSYRHTRDRDDSRDTDRDRDRSDRRSSHYHSRDSRDNNNRDRHTDRDHRDRDSSDHFKTRPGQFSGYSNKLSGSSSKSYQNSSSSNKNSTPQPKKVPNKIKNFKMSSALVNHLSNSLVGNFVQKELRRKYVIMFQNHSINKFLGESRKIIEKRQKELLNTNRLTSRSKVTYWRLALDYVSMFILVL